MSRDAPSSSSSTGAGPVSFPSCRHSATSAGNRVRCVCDLPVCTQQHSAWRLTILCKAVSPVSSRKKHDTHTRAAQSSHDSTYDQGEKHAALMQACTQLGYRLTHLVRSKNEVKGRRVNGVAQPIDKPAVVAFLPLAGGKPATQVGHSILRVHMQLAAAICVLDPPALVRLLLKHACPLHPRDVRGACRQPKGTAHEHMSGLSGQPHQHSGWLHSLTVKV